MSATLNGILVVDKPAGFTSHDVVAKLRGICQTRKIGHGGTLDPMATGVLPVFIGGAVKAVDLAPNQDKAYEALVCFGQCTDTGDVTGTVLEEVECRITPAMVKAALPGFLGPQMQTPPMYSAVKVNGVPLYKYAREGKEVARKARAVTFHELEVMDAAKNEENRVWLRVLCSKGTYVRTLVEDIGKALGVPATLGDLRRSSAGVFALAQAHTLDAIQAAKDEGRLAGLLLPVELLFESLPLCRVDAKGKTRLLNGAAVYGMKGAPGPCRVYAAEDGEQSFLGLGHLAETGELKAQKLFVERT